MEIKIRHIQPQDHAAVHQIFLSTAVIKGTMRLPYDAIEATRKRLTYQEGTLQLVACVDDEVVGFAELVTFPQVPRHRHVGEINMITVHPEWRGQGMGQALMQALIDLADNWLQLNRLSLMVWTTNEGAIHLYEKCGFVIEGTMRNYVFNHGAYADAYLMGRIKDDILNASTAISEILSSGSKQMVYG